MKLPQELIDKINLLDINPKTGSYFKTDLYLIGVEHKKLNNAQKSWEELGSLLNMGSEKLRCFVKSAQKRLHNTEDINVIRSYFNEYQQTTDEEELNNSILSDDTIKLQIEKNKYQMMKNNFNNAIRQEARVQEFKDAIIQAINTLPAFESISTSFNTNKLKHQECFNEAVLMLSDWHIGVDCSNYWNTYNLDIAKKRIEKLTRDTINYCKINKVGKLNVLNMGDLIHGIIHVTSRIEQNFDVATQIIKAGELLAQMLNELYVAFNGEVEITYRSVIDNHARMVANMKESIDEESFCRIIDWYIIERLKNTGIIFINDNIDLGLGLFTLGNGSKVVFVHGHQDGVNKSLQHFMGATREFIDYILMGHEHSEKSKVYQNTRVICNGSVVGVEQYAVSQRLFNRPSQKLLIFNNADNNVVDISIDLFNV